MNSLKKLSKDQQLAFQIVHDNIMDVKVFSLIRHEISGNIMARRNLKQFHTSFLNAMNCAIIITIFKVIDSGADVKSIFCLYDIVLKMYGPAHFKDKKLGENKKNVRVMVKRLKPLRDDVWGHPIGYRKPRNIPGKRAFPNGPEIDAYTNFLIKYHNEIIDIMESNNYRDMSQYGIKEKEIKSIETEVRSFLGTVKGQVLKRYTWNTAG